MTASSRLKLTRTWPEPSFRTRRPADVDQAAKALDAHGALQGPSRRAAPPWASKAFATWSTSAGRLVLKDGAGHVLVGFKRDDAVTYEAGTSSGDLIFLVRP